MPPGGFTSPGTSAGLTYRYRADPAAHGCAAGRLLGGGVSRWLGGMGSRTGLPALTVTGLPWWSSSTAVSWPLRIEQVASDRLIVPRSQGPCHSSENSRRLSRSGRRGANDSRPSWIPIGLGQRLVGDQLRLDGDPRAPLQRLHLVADGRDRPVGERDKAGGADPHRARPMTPTPGPAPPPPAGPAGAHASADCPYRTSNGSSSTSSRNSFPLVTLTIVCPDSGKPYPTSG